MSAYLVDYENVNSGGLKGLSELQRNDTVYIFYSDKANTLTFDAHKALNESKAEIEYMKVSAGEKNALDFQLASFLGYLVANDSSETYYVVSNDEGYSFVEEFWRAKGKNIERTTDIKGKETEHAANVKSRVKGKVKEKAAEKSQLKAQLKSQLRIYTKSQAKEKSVEKAEKESESMVEKVRALIPQYAKDVPVIAEYLDSHKTKQSFNNALMKSFGGEKTKEIYGALKPLLAGKKGK